MKRRRREALRRLRVALRVAFGRRVFRESEYGTGTHICDTKALHA